MKILDRLPISGDHTSLRFGQRYIKVRPDQIVVWLSVHIAGAIEPEENIPKFPALLDTGSNFGFAVQHRHLREWAGMDPGLLVSLGTVSILERVATRRRAAVWLYPNVPGRQDMAVDRPPFRLTMERGIAIYPTDTDPPGPRLPLLGLPALLDSSLDCWIDPERRHVNVRTRTWRRPLIRLLNNL